MEVKEIVEKYARNISDGKFFIAPNIPCEKLKNAIKSYANGVSVDEVIILLDDTVWGGAKEGLLLTKSAVYAKEFCVSPSSFLLRNIDNIYNNKNVIYINGNKFFKINMANIDTQYQLPLLINDIAKLSQNKLSDNQPQSNNPSIDQTNFLEDSELSKWGKIENDLLDTLTITDKNFFNELHKTIMQGHMENAADKLFAKTTYDLMLIALNFPNVINKNKIFSPKFLQMLHGNEDLSFELLAFVFARLQIILGPHIDRNQLTSIFEPFLITIFVSYATSKSNPEFEDGTIASLYNDPIKELANNEIMKTLSSRLNQYVYMRAQDPNKILYPHLIKSILEPYGLYLNSVIEIFEERLCSTLPEYVDYVDKHAEKVFYNYLKD